MLGPLLCTIAARHLSSAVVPFVCGRLVARTHHQLVRRRQVGFFGLRTQGSTKHRELRLAAALLGVASRRRRRRRCGPTLCEMNFAPQSATPGCVLCCLCVAPGDGVATLRSALAELFLIYNVTHSRTLDRCGLSIPPNPANMCSGCIRTQARGPLACLQSSSFTCPIFAALGAG